MSSLRSRRAWVPAALAPLVLVVLLLLAWGANKALNDGATSPPGADDSFLRWLLATNNTFFGSEPFSSGSGGRILAGTLVSVVLLLVVGFAIGMAGVRGLTPGSSAVPAFLSLWMALVLACVVAGTADYLVASSSRSGFQGRGRFVFSVLQGQLAYGAKWGWIAALLATLVWLVVRPRAAPVRLRDGPSTTTGTAAEDERNDAYAPRRRTEPDPDFHPAAVPGDQAEQTHGAEPTGDTYVGKYSTGRYGGPYAGGAETPEDPPSTRPGGSHRGDPTG
jgi:lysylphosphatidylglycerol synthetase-like protein (DUF2156 family)